MIVIWPDRAKRVRFRFRQGVAATSAPLDCTGATVAVLETSLPVVPTVEAVDAATGQFDLVFAAMPDLRRGSVHRAVVALTFPAGTSPDPVEVPVSVA